MLAKTPDEIKKKLVEAIAETFWAAKDGDAHDLLDACDMSHESMSDALAYIQQLEAERDAAVKDIEFDGACDACKHIEKDAGEPPCNRCFHVNKGQDSYFEWRGVQKEE